MADNKKSFVLYADLISVVNEHFFEFKTLHEFFKPAL